VRNIFEISNMAALDEISKLLELGVITQVGRGRSVHYVLE
jgi:predicted HTH transcriptional regulator